MVLLATTLATRTCSPVEHFVALASIDCLARTVHSPLLQLRPRYPDREHSVQDRFWSTQIALAYVVGGCPSVGGLSQSLTIWDKRVLRQTQTHEFSELDVYTATAAEQRIVGIAATQSYTIPASCFEALLLE